jgi:hypothetical protein
MGLLKARDGLNPIMARLTVLLLLGIVEYLCNYR